MYLNGDSTQESGIILPSEQGAICVSCKNQKHTCSHVRYVMELLSSGNSPVVLQHIANKASITNKVEKNKTCLLSHKEISFEQNLEMASIFQKPQSIRFNIIEGISCLNVDDSNFCSVCGQKFWKEATTTQSWIITNNQILPALGTFYDA